MPLNDITTEQTKATEKRKRLPTNCWITWQIIRIPPSDIMYQT
jgi:hypothetical protein